MIIDNERISDMGYCGLRMRVAACLKLILTPFLAAGLWAATSAPDAASVTANDAVGQLTARQDKLSVTRLYEPRQVVEFEQEQTVSETLMYSEFFGYSPVNSTIGASWSDTVFLDALVDIPLLGRTGVEMSIFSEGDLGLRLNFERGPVTFMLQVPVQVTLELPANEVVAPQETFTISTRWSTPNPTGQPEDGAKFTTSKPDSLDVSVGLIKELDFRIDTFSCFEDNCQTGEIALPEGPISTDMQFFRTGADLLLGKGFMQNLFQIGTEQSLPSFFEPLVDLVEGQIPDPLEVDVLQLVKGDFSGLSNIALGTDWSSAEVPMGNQSATAVPRGASISAGWIENAVDLTLDMTNIGPIAAGFYCNCFVPLLNGTFRDLAKIALAKADPTGSTSRGVTAMNWMGSAARYAIMEAEVTGKFEIADRFRLTPRPPEIRLLRDEVPISNWVKAGDDIRMTMPTTPGAMSVEVRAQPTFTSDVRILAKEYELFTQALRFDLAWWTLGPAEENRSVGFGDRWVVASNVQKAFLTPLEFTGDVEFPAPLSEPRVGLSGGNQMFFGPVGCWEPTNLPPEVPTGVTFDEDFGCVVSFRDLGISGSGYVTLDSFSSDPYIALTLLNSTMYGTGEDPADVTLDSGSNTSMYLTGDVRRPGLDNVDFFFDDAGSSGNWNRIIADSVHGAFISNSLLRGLTSNENQSDLIIEGGELWIDNTDMVLDNITVVEGAISMQDSEAELRNLQLGGSVESALRLTRDSLITTNSNASFNSSILEIGNGSLVNVSGAFNNVGEINLEQGGWLTVLEGDNPMLPDRLNANGVDEGIVNIFGISILEDADAALALVPMGPVDPMTIFTDHIEGTRLDTGVLWLGNGEIDNHRVNNVGGTVLSTGGTITNTEVALSENASILVARAPLSCTQCLVSGMGRLDIESGGTLLLDQSVIGDLVNDPNTLGVNNEGHFEVVSTAELKGNAVLTNTGTVEVAFDKFLELVDYRQFGGSINIDGGVKPNGEFDVSGGRVTGSGVVLGSVRNRNGVLLADNLGINGHYTQERTGTLLLDFSQTSNPLQPTVSAEIEGLLSIVLTQDVLDAITEGASFDFLQYPGGLTGEFERVNIEMEDGSEVEAWDAVVIYGATVATIHWTEGEPTDLGELPLFQDSFEWGPE